MAQAYRIWTTGEWAREGAGTTAREEVGACNEALEIPVPSKSPTCILLELLKYLWDHLVAPWHSPHI